MHATRSCRRAPRSPCGLRYRRSGNGPWLDSAVRGYERLKHYRALNRRLERVEFGAAGVQLGYQG